MLLDVSAQLCDACVERQEAVLLRWEVKGYAVAVCAYGVGLAVGRECMCVWRTACMLREEVVRGWRRGRSEGAGDGVYAALREQAVAGARVAVGQHCVMFV